MILITIDQLTYDCGDKYYLKLQAENGKTICDIRLSDILVGRFVYMDIIDLLKKHYKFSRIDIQINNEEVDF